MRQATGGGKRCRHEAVRCRRGLPCELTSEAEVVQTPPGAPLLAIDAPELAGACGISSRGRQHLQQSQQPLQRRAGRLQRRGRGAAAMQTRGVSVAAAERGCATWGSPAAVRAVSSQAARSGHMYVQICYCRCSPARVPWPWHLSVAVWSTVPRAQPRWRDCGSLGERLGPRT
jgi:hypothetical protein